MKTHLRLQLSTFTPAFDSGVRLDRFKGHYRLSVGRRQHWGVEISLETGASPRFKPYPFPPNLRAPFQGSEPRTGATLFRR